MYMRQNTGNIYLLFFILLVFSTGRAYTQCRPSWFTGLVNYGLYYSAGDTISRVSFHTLNHFSGNTAPVTDSVYSDYTYLSTSVCKGQSYTLSVWAGDSSVYQTGVIAWIDFNHNGIYETSEMVLQDSVRIQNRRQAASAQVTIPLNAATASVKMRVLSAYTIAAVFPNRMPPNDACFNYASVCKDSFPSLSGIPYPDIFPGCNQCISCDALTGEFEEYTIHILPRPVAGISGSQTICPGAQAQFSCSLTGTAPWALSWTDGIQTIQVTGITSSPYVVQTSPSVSSTFTLLNVSDAHCVGDVSGSHFIHVTGTVQASLTGITSVCSGNGAQISFHLSGAPPWDLDYSDGTVNFQVTGISASPWLLGVTPVSTHTYTPVAIRNACGSGTVLGNQVVQVADVLSAQISGGGIHCIGNASLVSVALTGLNPWAFTYSDGSTQFSVSGISSSPYVLSLSPVVHTTYTLVSVLDACSSSGILSGSAGFSTHVLPSVSFGNTTQYFCNSDPIVLNLNLSGTAPWSVSYSDGTNTYTRTGITTSTFQIQETANSTLTWTPVNVSDAYCTRHSGSGTEICILDPGPVAVITGNQSICAGSAATFSIIGTQGAQPWGFTFTDGTASVTHTGITSLPFQFSITPAASATYSISNIQHSCTSAVIGGTPQVLVQTLPIASLSAPVFVCTGSTAQLTFHLNGTSPWALQYSDGSGNISLTGISSSPYLHSVSPVLSTTYTLTQVQDLNCLLPLNAPAVVSVYQPVNVSISGSQTVCSGSAANISVQIQGTAPYSLNWSDGNITHFVTGITQSPYILNLSPAGSTTYSLLQSGNICGAVLFSQMTSEIEIEPVPSAILSGDQTLCGAGMAILSVHFTASTGPWDISWSEGSTVYSASQITSNPYLIYQPVSGSRLFMLNTIQTAYCSGVTSGSAAVQVLTAPSASWSDSLILCVGSPVHSVLSLSGTGPWDVDYSDGTLLHTLSGISSTSYMFNASPVSSTTYSLMSVRDVVCQRTAEGMIYAEIKNIPAALISGPSSACEGNLVQVSVVLAGTAPWNISWSDGQNTLHFTGIWAGPYVISLSPQAGASYSIPQVQDAHCMNVVSVPWVSSIQKQPSASFYATPQTQNTWHFYNTSQNMGSVNWDFGDGNISSQLNPTHVYAASGVYTVQLSVHNFCGTDQVDTVLAIVTQLEQGELQERWDLVLYPNPGSGFFEGKQTGSCMEFEYRILDVQGREVLAGESIREQNFILDLRRYPQGLYFLETRSCKGERKSFRISIVRN